MVTWVALVAVTVNVEEPPAEIVVGLALTATVGAAGGAATTVTLAVADTLPPAPLAVTV